MTGDFYFITFHANSIIDILHLSYSHLLKGTTPDRSLLCGSHQEHSWEDHAHLSLNSHQASVSHLLEKDLTYHGRKSEIYRLHHSFLFVLFLSVLAPSDHFSCFFILPQIGLDAGILIFFFPFGV